MRIVQNAAGRTHLRKVSAKPLMIEIGSAIHKATGGDAAGYRMSQTDQKSGFRVGIYTRTARAKRSNAKHNTLIRSLDAGRR